MTLPTKAKTWSFDINNRIVLSVSTTTGAQNILHTFVTHLLTMSGVTVKGSSNSTTGAMDGVNRLTTSTDWVRGTNTTTAQSWIVLDCANMGGTEICVAFCGASAYFTRVSFSPGGNYTASGTATHTPTATDEQLLAAGVAGVLHAGSGTADQLFTVGVSSDGQCLMWTSFQTGAVIAHGYIGLVANAVEGGLFSPAVVGFAPGASMGISSILNASGIGGGSSRALARANSTNLAVVGGARYVGGSFAQSTFTVPLDLQGSGYIMDPLEAWSNTASGRGKLGDFYDLYVGIVAASDGDTYPNTGTQHQWIAVGDLIMPWEDGTAPVTS